LPTGPDSNPPVFEAEFPFQKDLELELPIEILKQASNNKPHNYEPNGPKTNVYATFMATRNPSLKDAYFMAIHSLIYRVLWSPRSRTEKYPFVVFVGGFVTPEQRQLLSGAGAIVRELDPLEWNPNVEGVQRRWKDLFAKLNMWNQTEFSRILFLDADAFPVANVDSIFDISPTQNCIDSKLQPDDYLADGTQVCEPYVFAGVPQNPFNETDVNINVGSMVFAPSERMHQRLLQNYVKTDRYNCLMAEQAFLNWQFSVNGAFPATQLEREYGGFFPAENEEGMLKVVHEKLWSEDRSWLKQEWLSQWQEMLMFYTGTDFLEQRKRDG
ncbi:nucleotide-diphospho-sugar transferase, partial [Lindgomyces ingoldianus]